MLLFAEDACYPKVRNDIGDIPVDISPNQNIGELSLASPAALTPGMICVTLLKGSQLCSSCRLTIVDGDSRLVSQANSIKYS